MSPSIDTTYWTRWEDGAVPVRRTLLGARRVWTLGSTVYRTGRALMAALGRHRSRPDKYFKTGPREEAGLSWLVSRTDTEARPLSPSVTDLARPVADGHPVGIDLARRGHEVRKLLFAGFSRKIRAYGLDADDVLQEVYKGLLTRNAGRCPWDSRKSSFGHYVHMVISCVFSNYRKIQFRIRSREHTGMRVWTDEGLVETDAATAAREDESLREDPCQERRLSARQTERSLVRFLRTGTAGGTVSRDARDRRLAVTALPLVVEGMSRKEIAAATGLSVAHVTSAVARLRLDAGRWLETQG